MYQSKHKPYAHQQQALDRMKGRKAFALMMAMRTGKTKTMLDDFGRLEDAGEVEDLLVIAPAGVYRTWEKAVSDHVGDSLAQRLLIHTWSANAKKFDEARLQQFLKNPVPGQPRILLLNIEALSNVQRARNLAEGFLVQRKSMCVIDESTMIKNPQASRTKFVVERLGPLAEYRRILSGLPTPRSPMDIYSQFLFLGRSLLGFSSFFAFRARYAVMKSAQFGGRNLKLIVGFRDAEDLRQRIEPHSFRVLLEDCYDLPPKVYMTREVELTPEQKRVYSEMQKFATAALDDGKFVTATQVITQILRLHQVLCGHTVTEEGVRMSLPENRTQALLDLLEEYDGKAIIWCSYDADVQKVSEALRKTFECDVARFWGGNRSTREDEEKKFLNDPNCRFIVATAAAGGRGRTWMNADMVVYYSNTNDLEHRSQSEERPQGVGKTKSVAYVDLVVPGTVDEKIIKALRGKINLAATITGDNYREWLI
jgi:hypothetical protein